MVAKGGHVKWLRELWAEGITLRFLRALLPPFHPLKYRWIKWCYGAQREKAW